MIRTLRALQDRVPLRVTLVAALLLLVTIALGASGATATYVLRGYLISRLDAQLSTTTNQVAETIRKQQQNNSYSSRTPATIPIPVTRGTTSAFLWIGDAAGNVLNTNIDPPNNEENQGEPDTKARTLAYAEKLAGQPITVRPEDGRGFRWRVLMTVAGPDLVIIVALTQEDVDDTMPQLTNTLFAVDGLVLAALAVIGYLVVHTMLRRLTLVERAAQAIAAGDLTRRAPPAHPDTEVGRLSAAFNYMVSQIEMAFSARAASEYEARKSEARMRRFAADASHELRTPLTAIRGFAELYRQGGGDPAHIIGRIEHNATRMGVLVDDLLLLARLDQQRPLEMAPVDLLSLAAEAVHDTSATVTDHRVELRALAEEPPLVLGDESRLRQVVGNLVSNAVRHTPAGTEVTVTVDTAGGSAMLVVADTGPGLAPQDAARVFERFFRTDPARTRTLGGSGLGLSIVQALVEAHGGEVWLDTAPGEGARFMVRLPLFQPPHEISTEPAES
ncbi:two-component sensor histidine kinase [Virgisporangium aliadipatigenens]|uniref:histidine kinase n=1 Tax=Virgisporangium aliadipatigenens TaxID=741659 RepID=A0A8J3YNI5_9ACTN|nr:HAMP domain-containing sensor histidine kinase [Virgisporangium aliadipatigenens]GIJ47061.1 two-component sensor histidine kinase [Virgisporangium aliadipatigenens]